MISDKVLILGTEWRIEMRKKKDDSYLNNISGYCDNTIKTIVVRKFHETPKPHECVDLRELERATLRHEIVHAFMYESGLANDSSSSNHWAKNEEMIDWIAQQHERIHAAFLAAGAIWRVP